MSSIIGWALQNADSTLQRSLLRPKSETLHAIVTPLNTSNYNCPFLNLSGPTRHWSYTVKSVCQQGTLFALTVNRHSVSYYFNILAPILIFISLENITKQFVCKPRIDQNKKVWIYSQWTSRASLFFNSSNHPLGWTGHLCGTYVWHPCSKTMW